MCWKGCWGGVGGSPPVSPHGLVAGQYVGRAGPEPPSALLRASDAPRLPVSCPVWFVPPGKCAAKQPVAALGAAVEKNRSP